MTREERLRERVRHGVGAEHVELTDESGQHVGHAGAAAGAGHYRLLVVSARFDGLDPIARHRLVYAAVGDMIPGEVHALTVAAYTPAEWAASRG